MKVCNSILDAVGNTPLIRLNKLVDSKTMATVLLKAEFLEPSGSLKDRMALAIVLEAEEKGLLKPGGTIVEATAGNTGLSLAMVAAVRGYKSIFVMPDKFSVEKINMLKAFGSEVIITPTAVPDGHPESWKEVAKRIVSETPNSIFADQFYNRANVDAHYRTTGPEIWDQTDGKIDVFIAGAGSGGTISGVGRYLKEEKAKRGESVRVILMDPVGSAYYDNFYGRPQGIKRGYKMEGIGNDFVPGCLDFQYIDEVRRITDKPAFYYARRLARDEGLLVGDTSGGAIQIALEVAREIGPGKFIVCVLCDSGNRYISKLYNDDWMKKNGFGTLGLELWDGTVGEVLAFKGGSVEFAEGTQSIMEVVSRMSELGISQMPIRAAEGRPNLIVHESDLMHALLSGERSPADSVLTAANPLEGRLLSGDDIAFLEPLLDENNVAVVVDEADKIEGILTRIDVVRFLAERLKKSA